MRQFSNKARTLLSRVKKLPLVPSTLSTFNHGYYRKDDYQMIRYDPNWQASIIRREDDKHELWKEKMVYHKDEWQKHVLKWRDPGDEAVEPDQLGDYFYSISKKEYPKAPGELSGQYYDAYIRVKANTQY